VGQKTIGQLYADHPASSLAFTDLIEVEQGGLSKGSTLEKVAIAGVINPLVAVASANTTYTIATGERIQTCIIPKAYLLASTTASVLLTITTGVGGKETVVIPISGSGDTIDSPSLMFNIYIDSTGNVYSEAWDVSGHNANGSYVKFTDGTMEQWGSFGPAVVGQTIRGLPCAYTQFDTIQASYIPTILYDGTHCIWPQGLSQFTYLASQPNGAWYWTSKGRWR
jgi:hypothetical protein